MARIARAADIGERECLRCFKRAIQTSPMQYLLKYRITQGFHMLLRSPHSSISSIAGMCGFSSPSNFSQMFARFLSVRPENTGKSTARLLFALDFLPPEPGLCGRR
ncbi:MAG: helix-turn-helix domain-containing protein [Enterocloster clostridioformis]